MEKFAVDLDKVLDDFELQEGNFYFQVIILIWYEIYLKFNSNLDQAEEFIKHVDKCDTVLDEQEEVLHKNFPTATDFTIRELSVSDSVPEKTELISNINATEDSDSTSSKNVPQFEEAEIVVCSKNKENPQESNMKKSGDEHSNLNMLLLDLNETLHNLTKPEMINPDAIPLTTEGSNLLDQSFTEDIVTQPLLSDFIQNGAFNPSHPDTLTDDELESYLAELEKEDEGGIEAEISYQSTNSIVDTGDILNGAPDTLPKIAELNKDTDAINSEFENEAITAVVPLSQVAESLPLSDSEVTSTEESTESSYTDSDTGEGNPQEDSTSAEEEMPQLIDDPSLTNNSIQATSQNAECEVPVHQQDETHVEDNEEIPQFTREESVPEAAGASEQSVFESQIPRATSGDESGVVGILQNNDESALEPYSSLTEDERLLGVLKPIWIPDEEAPQCMNCSQRFTGNDHLQSCVIL